MIYKEFGRTGKKVSAVGFGGMRFDLKEDMEKNAELLIHAHQKGINYFDTAPEYCEDKSEDIFGLAIPEMIRQQGRNSFYVGTKAMPTAVDTAKGVQEVVDRSLKRMRLEKLDFFYVWCVRKYEHYELAMKKGGLYEGLLDYQQQGLVDHILISTHLPGDQIGTILRRGEFDGVLLGMNILNFPYRWEGVQAAYQEKLGVLAMNPLAGGIIPRHSDRLAFLGDKKESPTEAALRFVISCPQISIALNGFTTKEYIDTACRVADGCKPFSDKEIDSLRKHVAQNMNQLCTGCGYCMKDCPENIPIANYLQVYNEKLLAGDDKPKMAESLKIHHKWGLLVEQPAGAGDCVECGRCEEACTQHLPIMERLKELAAWEKEMAKQTGGKGA